MYYLPPSSSLSFRYIGMRIKSSFQMGGGGKHLNLSDYLKMSFGNLESDLQKPIIWAYLIEGDFSGEDVLKLLSYFTHSSTLRKYQIMYLDTMTRTFIMMTDSANLRWKGWNRYSLQIIYFSDQSNMSWSSNSHYTPRKFENMCYSVIFAIWPIRSKLTDFLSIEGI